MNPFKLLQAYWKISSLESEAVEVKTVNNQAKPGWKTSEFWLHVLAQAPAIAGIFLGATNPVVLGLAAISTLGAAVYTASRTSVKNQAGTIALSAAAAALPIVADAVKTPTPGATPSANALDAATKAVNAAAAAIQRAIDTTPAPGAQNDGKAGS